MRKITIPTSANQSAAAPKSGIFNQHPSGSSYVKVDCETDTHVYEGGLDKRSPLDSIQQALFFSYLTGKKPAVVIYDADGKVGRFEHRIMKACEMAGVEFIGG